jgi:hypothetical protein
VRQVTVQPGRWRRLQWPGVDSGLGRLVGNDGREGRERRQHGHGGHVGAAAVGLEAASRCLETIAVVALANLIVVLQTAMVEWEAPAAARVWEWKSVMRLLLEAKTRGVHGVVVGALHHQHLAVLVHCLVEYPADHPFLLRASKDSVNQHALE